jgi:hypothetical protein
MSKENDKLAETPGNTIELLKAPIPMAPPPDPYNRGEGRSLGENQAKPDAAKETKVAMAAADQPKQQTWVERIEGTKKAFNENNSESKGKNLHNAQPAAATVTTEKSEPPKVEPKASEFVKRLQSTPPPPPTNKPSGPRK